MSAVEFVNTRPHHVKPAGFPRLINPGARYAAETEEQIEGAYACRGQEPAGSKAAAETEAAKPHVPRVGDPLGEQTQRRQAVGAVSALSKPIQTGGSEEAVAAAETKVDQKLGQSNGTVTTDDLQGSEPKAVVEDLDAMTVAELADLAKVRGVEVTGTGSKGARKKSDYIEALGG